MDDCHARGEVGACDNKIRAAPALRVRRETTLQLVDCKNRQDLLALQPELLQSKEDFVDSKKVRLRGEWLWEDDIALTGNGLYTSLPQ